MSRPTWGDEVSEALDEIPPTTIVGPDSNGIKIVTEYYIDEDGKKFKIVRRIKVKKVTQVVNHDVARRKHLKKFGSAANHPAGPSPSTTNIGEDIPLKLSLKTSLVEVEEEKPDAFGALGKAKSKLVVCRICKGDHWTLKCPYKDTIGALAEITSEEPKEEQPAESQQSNKSAGAGKYVPPSLRGGAGAEKKGESMNRDKEDFPTLRVSNLSDDTKERDVQELFRSFGPVHRVFLAKNKNTGDSRGYAYVSFYNRPDAEQALKHLNGYGYDNLILQVEWSVRN